MSHATARIIDITFVPGDDVDVQVRNGLTSGISNVDPDVVAIRTILGVHYPTRILNPIEKRAALCRRRVEPGRNMSASDKKGMAPTDREGIPKTEDEIGSIEDALRLWITEWARHRTFSEGVTVEFGARR